MQRMAGNMEDQLILKSIREECLFENLPKRLQIALSTKEEYHRRVVEYCIKKRLQWNLSFARKVIKEAEYYEDMMRYLRRNLALFPYHLAEYICRVMRVSPFRYYCDMLFEVMKNEQPYDSIPNFSAADALRLTGIGRNEFIDIMNKCRSKKIMWKLNKSIAKEMLPNQPVDFTIESWWGVSLVNFTIEEFKKLTEEEMATIDKICKEEANSYVIFEPDIIKALHKRGLVYFDVPVYPDDRFKVSRLEGFVSNREQQYEDPIEELLYHVFVVLSENATVSELASTLQADLTQLQSAASFACRLGWAEKLLDPSSFLSSSAPGGDSYNTILMSDEEGDVSEEREKVVGEEREKVVRGGNGDASVGLVVDANVTSYLMMGSISPGLKQHAVTLYEAGKLGDSCISSLITDLASLETSKFEGELQDFANHAFSLRSLLQCIKSGGQSNQEITKIPPSSNQEITQINQEMTKIPSPDAEITKTPSPDAEITESVKTEESEITKTESVKMRKYKVDILRCESLASLTPLTLERLYNRDYDIIISMVPFPSLSILPNPTGPVHFGPPSYSSVTPWMKLVLYTTGACGPVSVILMKGQRLRSLPAPLFGCEKALVWSWDGGNLGGKFEEKGNLVKGSLLLYCLNSLLRNSAVLVQPLCKEDLDKDGKIVTLDLALPLMIDSDEVSKGGESESTNLSLFFESLAGLSTLGYLRLIRLRKISQNGRKNDSEYEWVPLGLEFGVPLSNPKLCLKIRDNIIKSGILQTDSKFRTYHEAMQNLRKKLREMCNEYQATGPVAKLLYQKAEKEKEKESGKNLKQMVSYASGRWSPLLEDSGGALNAKGGALNVGSEHERLRVNRRQRCRTEVVSFDGNILRSYALAPVYEALSRPITEDSSSSSSSPLTNLSKQESSSNEDSESKDVVLPGVNLVFDGAELRPFDITACLQARQPVLLVAEASSASVSVHTSKVSS